MIDSIFIKDVATYDHEGIEMNDLKKINFIYGANGCGKTTISNFILDPVDEKYSGSSLIWKSANSLQTLVYNKEFRDRNFGNGKINGVFTLGHATAEEIKTIESKQESLKTIVDEGKQKRKTLDKLKADKEKVENDFKENTWTKVYKNHEFQFKEAFSGFIKKDSFKSKLISEASTNQAPLETLESLVKRAKTLFGEEPQSMELISDFDYTRVLKIEAHEIWEKIVVGKSDVNIAGLIQKLNINDWVNQGKKYVQDDTCPFCQENTITNDFKSQLDNFFDESYTTNIETIRDLKNEYSTSTENIVHLLNSIEKTQKEDKGSKLELDPFSSNLKTVISQIAANNELLLAKTKEPSRSINLLSLKDQLQTINTLIKEANSEIKAHNKLVSNFSSEKALLKKSIWCYLVNEYEKEINEFNSTTRGLDKGIDTVGSQYKSKLKEHKLLDTEIKELGKNITSIQPTIDEINRILKSYGFLNFEIVPAEEKGFYRIQRQNGTIAESTLSEGEITFLTFLYYLQLTKGGLTKEDVNSERILVIDDPISSLDSNVLFVVSTLVKSIIKDIKSDRGNIKQLILLTHNVYFHKEVSFIDGRTKVCNQTQYWILRKIENVTNLQAFLMNNPIHSSYELLWKELQNEGIESTITIQNIMRRIIENYFKLLGRYGDDDLIQKFATKEEQEICKSLISWINDGSHSINDDLFIELQDRTVEAYKKVFKDIFKLTDHEGHYNMMMNISEH